MLDERKRKILKEIVDEYIESAEPVSSAVIVEKYEQDISSATVRNDMAELEKAGYLEKPHTSAGRVPSAKGYRLYVDELLKYDDISLEEIKYIQEKLETKMTGIEELTKIATTTLSEITHYTTVSIGPKTSKQNIEEIKFVMLGNRMLMGIIVTDTGLVRETIIKFDEDITEEQIETLNYFFNNKLKGEPIEKIDTSFEEYIFRELKYSVNIIRPIIEQMKKLIEEEEKIYLEGTNKSFELPEFKS
ncbi:MAG: heat-inducible transcriptional repressor HrcA, partial [Clostridia bacterium]|nr:heat-inducible transcriptional repressor HrcA [Clostridia bacterium]